MKTPFLPLSRVFKRYIYGDMKKIYFRVTLVKIRPSARAGVTGKMPVKSRILVKLELWESVMVIISFGLPLTYAYATLRQSVAGNSTFWGIVLCNLGITKTVISNFVTSRQIETPYLSP